jgi:superoxide dismutase, Fe-Mn family
VGGQESRAYLPSVHRKSFRCQDRKILNNALQHWNHTFFWHCITPYTSAPEGQLKKQIESKWQSVEHFLKEFAAQAVSNFGSGWTWLAKRGKELFIVNTSNAENPMNQDYQPLLTIDIWEHAYYIDYRNARPKYVETVCSLIDWRFVEGNFKAEQVRVKL